MGKHARLSPSAAHRWMNCPGSIVLSEQCDPPKPSEYAEEGTTAHGLAEAYLRQKYFGETGLEDKISKIKKSEWYCGEMEEAVGFYIDTIDEKLLAAENGELLVEQTLDLTGYIPEGFGSADAVILSDGTMEVIDLKYGKGIKVEAKENPQLRLYGLGAFEKFKALYDIDEVRTTIVQPRLDHVSTESLKVGDLISWANTVVTPQAKKADEGVEEYCAGDWCRFCPANPICRTLYNDNMALEDFKKHPDLLSEDEIAEALVKVDSHVKWAKDLKDYALEKALAGTKYKGWKIVEGRANRKYKDETEVASALKAAGYDEAVLYTRSLLGITDMEKLVGKKAFGELLKDLVIKPEGKATLAPESDPRDEISSAKNDFKED